MFTHQQKRNCLLAISLICLVLLNSCHQNKPTPSADPERIHYTRYREIFKNYRQVPLNNTLQKLDSFLLSFPEDARAWAFYGRLMYDQDSTEKSIAAYKNAIHFNPRFSEGYAGAGSVYHVLNQTDSAEFYLTKAIELHDSSAYTYLNLSMLCLKKNQLEKSLSFADSAFIREDSSAAVCSGLSYIFKEQKLKKRSDEMYQRALQLGLTDTVNFKQVLQGKIPIQTFFRNNGY